MRRLLAVSAALAVVVATAGLASATDRKVSAVGDISYDPDARGGTSASTYYAKQIAVAGRISAFNPYQLLVLGDEQYENGRGDDFDCAITSDDDGGNCDAYDSNEGAGAHSYGEFKSISKPVPGNHEYDDPNETAEGYRAYFGSEAPATGPLYYKYVIDTSATATNDWDVYAVDSDMCVGGGGPGFGPEDCEPNGSQYEFFENEITSNPSLTDCSLAFWHHPRFSDGNDHGDYSEMFDMYKLFETDGNVDIILAGHSHNYMRYPKATASGGTQSDAARSWVVGTGGRTPTGVTSGTSVLTADRLIGNENGVLNLTLRPHEYDYSFVDMDGNVLDSATDVRCTNDPDV